MTPLCERIDAILHSMNQATLRSGREPGAVRLVAVSKTVAAERIQEAMACGQLHFGENYLQEAREKIPRLDRRANWHFIGRLQSNKCREVAGLFDVIETVDRLKVAQRLDEQARSLGRTLRILVQVNIGEEPQKAGIMPEETAALLAGVAACPYLSCLGLMALPPFFDDPEASRPYFRQLRQLAEACARRELFTNNQQVELSMGMSGDYAAAIEEGATIIRVGTAIFGARGLQGETA